MTTWHSLLSEVVSAVLLTDTSTINYKWIYDNVTQFTLGGCKSGVTHRHIYNKLQMDLWQRDAVDSRRL